MNALSSWDSLPVCTLIRWFQVSQVTLAQWGTLLLLVGMNIYVVPPNNPS